MTYRAEHESWLHEINTRSARLSRQSNKGGRTFVDYVRIFSGLAVAVPLVLWMAFLLRDGL